MDILICGDSVSLHKTIAEGLRRHEHRVTVATSALEALEICQTAIFDAILVDLDSPGMEGWSLGSRVREMEGGKNVQMVALTVRQTKSESMRAALEGFDRHLHKPATLHAIESALAGLETKHTAWLLIHGKSA